MDKNLIKLNKIAKTVGIIAIVIFSVPALLSLLTGNTIAALCFVPFVALGVLLILAYKKQTIAVNDDEIIFNYIFKSSLHVQYKNLKCLLLIPLNNKTQMALIDKKYNRLVSLDSMMSDPEILFEALAENEVEIVNFGELVEQEQDVSKYVKALNFIERSYYSSIAAEGKTLEALSQNDSKLNIAKTKKLLKIIGWILIIANPVAYFIGGKKMIVILIAILLFSYGLYIRYYPYIYVDTVSKNGKNRPLQLPILGTVIALLLNLTILKLYNYDAGEFFKITAVITVILAIPFIIKSIRTSVPQKTGRKISVIFAAFIISFAIAFPVNFLMTFESSTHETIEITDKYIGSGKSRDYYLCGEWRNDEEHFVVSKSEYEKTSVGDELRVCIKTSAFGLEYYTLHE